MMNRRTLHIIRTLFSMGLLFSLSSINAQEVANMHQIKILSRPQPSKNKIMLRWGTTTPRAWRKLNKYGYEIKRYTISRDLKTLSVPIEKYIGTFKPKDAENWKTIVQENNNAAIMAQSLFGESFNVEGVGTLQGIINMSQEQEQRFTWALYVADQDFEVAKMAGLGYEDFDIKPNEKYVYKVTSLAPESELKIEEGGVFVGIQDYQELPKPLDLAGLFTDEKAMLSWNFAIHKKEYNSYFIERSEDGKTFEQLNKLPYTTLNSGGKVDTKRIFYVDSIQNGKTYFYRVKGRTPFGEISPSSDVVSGKGEKILAYVPKITTKRYLDDKRIILEWDFMEEGNKYITGFTLNKSDKADGVYKKVIENIPPTARKIQYDKMDPTNYFTITAVGKEGGNRTSYPSLVQPVDSVPPVKPVGLEGKVDTLGIVTLKWTANKEPDMLGYRVFRGNTAKEEFTQLTVSPHKATIYYDSVAVKTLNDKVYYKLVAVDERFNMSAYSEVLTLKKPDVVPPAAAVFKSFKIEENKVLLRWTNSHSTDVVKHEVYRRVQDSEQWEVIGFTPKDSLTVNEFKDVTALEGMKYQYTVKAVDDSNLKSDAAVPINVQIPKSGVRAPIENIRTYIDKVNGYIELFWKAYDQSDVAEIMIYKGLKDKPITLYRNVLPSVKRIVDAKVKPNNIYTYIFRPIFKDGGMGAITKLEVKY